MIGTLDHVRTLGHPERVPRPLHHQQRYGDQLQLRKATAVRTTRWVQRESKAQDPVRGHRRGCAARDPSTGTAPTDDERTAGDGGQDVQPGLVQTGRCLRDPAALHAPGLLDENHAPADVERGTAGGQEVQRLDTAAGTVSHDEQTVPGTCAVQASEPANGGDVRAGEIHPQKGRRDIVLATDPEKPSSIVPGEGSPYWRFYDAVATEQLLAWLPDEPSQILDLSDDASDRPEALRDLGHSVVRLGRTALPGLTTVLADPLSLEWIQEGSLDAVVAEGSALSLCLAMEETAKSLARRLRPGGRLLLVVDSYITGLARLADQGRWAELADVPFADVVLVPTPNGGMSRCFWPVELRELLVDAGLEVEWVQPRTHVTPSVAEQFLREGGSGALQTLIHSEERLARQGHGDGGIHLVASARRP